jgi:hypothetical protein
MAESYDGRKSSLKSPEVCRTEPAYVAGPAVVRQFLATFKRLSADPASSFGIDQLVEKMQGSFEAVHSN